MCVFQMCELQPCVYVKINVHAIFIVIQICILVMLPTVALFRGLERCIHLHTINCIHVQLQEILPIMYYTQHWPRGF